MFQLADIVKIHKDGSTLFTVVDFADDGRPIVEPIGDAPGKYACSADPAYLVHVTPNDAAENVSS